MCLLVPPSCTRVKAQDTLDVVTKVLMVCCKIQSSNVGETKGLGDRCGEALHTIKDWKTTLSQDRFIVNKAHQRNGQI